MSNKLQQLPRRAAALLLAILLALAPLPASATSNHPFAGWIENNECEWRGDHYYDEVGSGFARGVTWGRGECAEVHVKVWYDDTFVQDWDRTTARASVHGWDLDFKYSDHNADPVGPPYYVGFRLW